MRIFLLASLLLVSAALFGQDKRPQQLDQSTPQQPNTHVRTVRAAPSLAGKLPDLTRPDQGQRRTSTVDFSNVQQHALPQTGSAPRQIVQTESVDVYAVNQFLKSTQGRRYTSMSPAAAATAVIQEIELPLINADQELAFVSESIDRLNMRHLRMKQYFEGVPVLGGEVIIHQAADGFTSVSGRLQPSLKRFDVSPDLSISQARDEVYALVGQPATYEATSPMALAAASDSAPELVVWYDENKTPHLAYVMTVHPDLAHRYEVIIDANDGTELRRLDQICRAFDGLHNHAKNGEESHGHTSNENHPSAKSTTILSGPETATARDLNGVIQTLQVFEESDFFLVDATRPMFDPTSQVPNNARGVIVTANAQGTYPDNSFNAVYSSSRTNNWTDPSEVSAHFNAQASYEYFFNTFGRNSIDNNGGTVISFVNVTDENGRAFDNAFWNGRAMFYGNGNTAFTPLAGALDVGGHEMSHGVVQEAANLEYQGESGALNESFADVFAVLIDRDNFLVGEDVVIRSQFPSGALRSMSDPTQGGNSLSDPGYQPGTYATRFTGSQDNGGVHINSGIPNNAFFRIATAIGKEKTEQLYYDVLTNFLTRNSQFIDLRNALQQRATAVYGANSTEFNAVVAGLDAVGIPGSSSGGGGTTGPADQTINPGDELVAFADSAERIVRLTDINGNIVIGDITPTALPGSKVSVTDDGSIAMIATTDGQINVISIDYNTNTVSENLIDFDADGDGDSDVRNVAISRDGSHFALVTTAMDPNIYVFNFDSGQGQIFPLYSPGSNGEPVFTIDFADVLEWDYEGRTIIYDALNTLVGANGLSYSNFDIHVIEVLDSDGFDDGRIQRIFEGLEEGTSLGNPTLSKNSENIMAFDFFRDDEWNLVLFDLETGTSNVLFQSPELTWPTYNAADNLLIFNATNNGTEILAVAELAPDKLTNASTAGDLFLFADDAFRGTAFANGQRVIVSGIADILAGATWTLAPNPASDRIEILRSASAKTSDASFELYDMNGRLLQTLNANVLNIDLSGLTPGTYTLKQGERSKVFIKH